MSDSEHVHTQSPAILIDIRGDQTIPAEVGTVIELLERMRRTASDEHATRERAYKNSALYRVDPWRTSKVALIEGSRGSGKTTLLLRVLNALLPLEDAGGGSGRQFSHIHAIGLLDLETLPEGVPLVTQVLTQLHRTLDLEARGTGAPLLGSSTTTLHDEWQRVLDTVGRGWRNNLSARAGSLEPGDYAFALEVAARHGADHGQAYSEFMDRLAELYRRAAQHEPLFVIAVDDADMHPARSAELLHLVRSLWHPNFAFLLAGDRDMFLLGLRCEYVRRTGACGDDDKLPFQTRPLLASTLALEALDKSIPRIHQVHLLPLAASHCWAIARDRFAEYGLLISGEIALLTAISPALCSALPSHYRELNQSIDEIAWSLRRAGAAQLTGAFLAMQLWRYACERENVPSEIDTLLQAGDEHIVLSMGREGPPGLYLSDVTRLQLEVPRTRAARFRGGSDQTLWPEATPASLPMPRVAAAFHLLAFTTCSYLGPWSLRAPTAYGLVATRVPAHLYSGGLPIWFEQLVFGCEPYTLLVYAGRLKRRQDARLSGRGDHDLGSALRDLIRATSEPATLQECDDFQGNWPGFIQRELANSSSSYDPAVMAVLCALPESGLSPDTANELFADAVVLMQGHDQQVREIVVERRVNRTADAFRRNGEYYDEGVDSEEGVAGDGQQRAINWLRTVDDASPGYQAVRWIGPNAVAPLAGHDPVQALRTRIPYELLDIPLCQSWMSPYQGLQKYFTKNRLNIILSAKQSDAIARSHAHAFESALGALPSGDGSIYVQLRALWHAVDAPQWGVGAGTFIARFRPDRVMLSQQIRYPALEACDEVYRLNIADDEAVFSRAQMSIARGPSGPLELNPVQRVLLRVLRDIERDTSDAGRAPADQLCGWPVRIRWAHDELEVIWPSVAFDAPVDHELLCNQWNRLVDTLGELERLYTIESDSGGTPAAPSRPLLDDIALAHLRIVSDVASSRREQDEYRHDFRPFDVQLKRTVGFPRSGGLLDVGVLASVLVDGWGGRLGQAP